MICWFIGGLGVRRQGPKEEEGEGARPYLLSRRGGGGGGREGGRGEGLGGREREAARECEGAV